MTSDFGRHSQAAVRAVRRLRSRTLRSWLGVGLIGAAAACASAAAPEAGFVRCLDFEATDDTLFRTAEDIYIADAFTFELWFRTSSESNASYIGGLYKDGVPDALNAATIQLDSTQLRFTYRGTPSDSGGVNIFDYTNYVDGAWHHLAVTFDGDTLVLYVDGAFVDQVSDAAPALAQNLRLYLGGNGGNPNPFSNAQVDDVRIWNVARTADQIRAYRSIPLSGAESGLIGYWTFDDADDNLDDKTGNGHTLNHVQGSRTWPASSLPSTLFNDEDTEWIMPLAGYDGDGDSLTARITALPTRGYLYQVSANAKSTRITSTGTTVTEANNQVYYVPAPNWNGMESFEYVLNDGGSDSAARTVNVTLASVNDLPVAGYGTALDFDGVNDLVNLGDVLEAFSECTFEAWIYYRLPSGENFLEICSKEHVNSFSLTGTPLSGADRAVHFNLGDGGSWYTGTNSTLELSTNTWHHVALSWDQAADTAKLFINGVLEETWAPGATSVGNTTRDRYIGAKVNSGGALGWFSGRIDELRIWTVARTDQEVADDRYRTLDGTETGLAGYWHFNDGSGDLLDDLSSNDYNGELTNMDSGTDWVFSGGTVDYAALEDTVLTGFVPATDVDGDTLTFARVSDAVNGTVVFTDTAAGVFEFTPDRDFNGADSFTYKVNDGNGDSNTATVALAVASKPDVVAVSPAQAANGTAANANIAVTFDVSIDPASLTAGSIYLYGSLSGRQAPVPSWDGGSNTATLNPSEDFLPGETVYVVVTEAVVDGSGTATSPFLWQFTVASGLGHLAFDPAQTVANSNTSSHSLGAADLDGDGDVDVISGIYSSGNEWFSNNGTNTPFNAVAPLTAGSSAPGPKDIDAADIDGDGYLDLITAFPNINDEVTFNNGTANAFNGVSDQAIAGDTLTTHALATGDIDRDGDIDIVASELNDRNRLYLNDGAGNFTASDLGTDADRTFDIALADMDNDGDLDLVTANEGQTEKLYLNNGTGSPFAGVTALDIGTRTDNSQAIAVGDLNNDGLLDVVVGISGAPNRYYLNNGTANPFVAATAHALGSRSDVTDDVQVADMDGDGALDVVETNESWTSNWIYLNNGTATPFAGAVEVAITSDADRNQRAVVADFNGDSVLDVAMNVLGTNDKIYLSVFPATVTTTAISNIATTTADGGGNVTNDGSSVITARGVCWNTTGSPTIADSTTSDGTGTGSFTSGLTGLSPNTTYYVRAYATNGAGTAYGPQVSFTTDVALPTVTTTAVSNIGEYEADAGGDVIDDGGDVISARGVCWNTTGTPTLADDFTDDGGGPGTFATMLAGLAPNVTYYVRAYATNTAGTAYGNQVSFTTLTALPTVTTTAISGLGETVADTGGNVTDAGGDTVIARGVCWNLTGTPTLADQFTTDGGGTGGFVSNLTGLTPSTPYFVRAYATNSKGTAYGPEIEFTTYVIPPFVTTAEIANVGTASAEGGGEVTSANGAPITARGICWNTTGDPTIDNFLTSDGTGTGSFSSVLPHLQPDTTYYVRAYAANWSGVGYGSQKTFTTALVRVPDLRVTIEAGNADARIGQEITFAVDVANLGNGDATDVVLRVPLPPETELVGAWLVPANVAQSIPLDARVEGGEVVIELGDVQAADRRAIELALLAKSAGALTLRADVSAAEQPTPISAQANQDIVEDDVYWEVVTETTPIGPCGFIGVAPLLATLLGFAIIRRNATHPRKADFRKTRR